MNSQEPPEQHQPPTQEEINAICRPPALRFSKEIVEMANKKFEGYAPFWAPLIAAFTTQNVLLMCLLESQEAGSEDGLKAINTFFDQCKFQAASHWRGDGFVKQFGKPKKRSLIIAP